MNASSKETIHIDSNTSITRLIKNGVIKYKNETFPVYEHHGVYKIDLDRPVKDPLDLHSEQDIINKANDILQLRFKRQPTLFMENPDAFKTMLRTSFSGELREHFHVLTMDNRHRLLSDTRLFSGCIASASVSPRIVIQHCLQQNAASCCVAHNHPSGVSTESRQDVALSQKLKKALEMVEIRLLDSFCLLYTSPSPRDLSTSRMPSSA